MNTVKMSWSSLPLLIVVSYACICLFVYLIQRSLIYFPTSAGSAEQAEKLVINSGGESLLVWKIAGHGGKAIIYFGGNAENVAGNIPMFTGLFPEHAVYLVNYRGYSGSTGVPSEKALYQDALAVYDYLVPQYPSISVLGRSLGSGVATYLASQRKLSKMALVTPYDSLTSVASEAYPWLPVHWLLKDRFASVERVDKLALPTLLLIAEHDEIIPRDSSEALARAFQPDLVYKQVINNAGHNTIGMMPEYVKQLAWFFNH